MGREKRKWEIEDREAEVYTGGGGRGALAVPPALKLFKPPKSGTFRVDFVAFECGPAVKRFAPDLRFTDPGKLHWNVVYWLHFGVGPNNAAVVCPQKTFGRACPVCREAAKYGSKPHPDDAAAARELRARERQLSLVSLFNDRTGESGPVELWDIATFNFKENLKTFQTSADTPAEAAEYRRFWVPEENLRVKLLAQEKPAGGGRMSTQYTVMEMKRPREPLPDDIWDHGYDLFSFPRGVSYETISQMFHGVDEGGEAPDADADRGDEAPARKPKAEKPRPEPEPEPEEERPALKKPAGKPKKGVYAAGDTVVYRDGSSMVRGTVVDSEEDRQTCRVKFDGRNSPVTLDWEDEDLKHASDPDARKAVEEPEERPKPKAGKPARPPEEDEDARDAPPPKKAAKVEAPPPRTDDDDEPTPAKRAVRPPASAWDDADDDPKPRNRK